ncbi:MAG: GntR family transcriptional regulator [Clostridium sp.]|nr:GntR family transcriptional regulator [Clostridium sp.]
MKHKYEKIEESITSWVLTNKYKPLEKIPTEAELIKIFKVSRHTIKKGY